MHIGIEKSLNSVLKECKHPPDVLVINCHADGAQAYNQPGDQIWPIQCRVVNLLEFKPVACRIYKGESKPACPEDFFKIFLTRSKF